MHRASPNIYEGELHDLTHSLVPDLKAVARTDSNVAIYIGNGHAAWEAALANCTSRGDTVLVLATGRFCVGWGEMAEGLGATVQTIDYGMTSDVALAQVLRGRLQSLPVTAATSAERYQKAGWLRRGARNLWTLLRFQLGASPDDLARSYRR